MLTDNYGLAHFQMRSTNSIMAPVLAGALGALVPGTSPALVQPLGDSSGVAISDDGRYLAFACNAPNLLPYDTDYTTDILLYDRLSHAVLVATYSCSNQYWLGGDAGDPWLTPDATWLGFSSTGTNLVAPRPCVETVTNFTTPLIRNVYVTQGRGKFEGAFYTGSGSSPPPGITLCSRSITGKGGNGHSRYVSLTADGRFVCFQSAASDLMPGDTNNASDVFVFDRDADGNGIFDESPTNGTVALERVSRTLGGAFPGGASSMPRISRDGRYVVYNSTASGLATNPGSGIRNYLYDRSNQITRLIGDGTYPTFSADGQYIGYVAASRARRVDRGLNGSVLVSVGTNASAFAFGDFCLLGGDGRLALFSGSSVSVAGDTNGTSDVCVRDLQSEVNELASISTGGALGNGASGGPGQTAAMTPDARYVVFESLAKNLHPPNATNFHRKIIVRDRVAGTTESFEVDSMPPQWGPGATATVSQVGTASALVTWTAATDDAQMAYHTLGVLGRPASDKHAPPALAGYVTGLAPGSASTAEVRAIDAAGNWSTGRLRTVVVTAAAPPDSDGDGMPDAWELLAFGHATAGVATNDSDLDGALNLEEYLSDTHPGQSGSVFRVTSITAAGVGLASSTGRLYFVETGRTLGGAQTWTPEGSPSGGTGGLLLLPASSTNAAVFRRVRASVR